MRMPFGKHYGQTISAIPTSYLRWLLREVVNLDPALRVEVEAVLQQRERGDVPAPASALADLRGMIRSWHRQLVLQFHPDRRPGQSDEAMRAVNAAHALLLEMLE